VTLIVGYADHQYQVMYLDTTPDTDTYRMMTLLYPTTRPEYYIRPAASNDVKHKKGRVERKLTDLEKEVECGKFLRGLEDFLVCTLYSLVTIEQNLICPSNCRPVQHTVV
jgi:hypothetical protein